MKVAHIPVLTNKLLVDSGKIQYGVIDKLNFVQSIANQVLSNTSLHDQAGIISKDKIKTENWKNLCKEAIVYVATRNTQLSQQIIAFDDDKMNQFLEIIIKEIEENFLNDKKVIIKEEECKQITGLSRTTRWRLEKEGKFPKRYKVGTKVTGWLESEIQDWIKNLGDRNEQ